MITSGSQGQSRRLKKLASRTGEDEIRLDVAGLWIGFQASAGIKSSYVGALEIRDSRFPAPSMAIPMGKLNVVLAPAIVASSVPSGEN